MRAIMESLFCVAYLILVTVLGCRMVAQSPRGSQRRLFGITSLILVGGDAFHLVPRIYALATNTLEQSAAALGFGTLVTSVTMTVFYVLVYFFWCRRYRKPLQSGLTAAVVALALCRIVLCLMPQNDWLSASAPLSWGIYRNIPFAILGALIAYLYYVEAQKAHDAAFRWAWLAIVLSFAFYLPVVLWADALPLIGLLMLPKTVCYVWLVLMGYRDRQKER